MEINNGVIMSNIKYIKINSETIHIFPYIHKFFLLEMFNT